jgi:DNA mismatch endonuclease (patch repair protein)
MSRIRSQDTAPELTVRRFLHRQGLRFRLHLRTLPGKPDLVFASRRTCLFVHGCFWHGCPHCIDGTRRVKSNAAYWSEKVASNRARDENHRSALEARGWRVLVLWECELRNAGQLIALAEKIKALPCVAQDRNALLTARLPASPRPTPDATFRQPDQPA